MPQLDGLRGCAVLSVLVFHLIPQYFDNSPLGWIGVRLFFVLSGFLITGILLRGRELARSGVQSVGFTLRQFYARRFLRIFPIYYLVLIILFIFGAEEIRPKFLWHLAYLSNFKFVIDGYFAKWVAHFWTLSVEEQFYLLWPVIVLFTPRKGLVPVLSAAIAVGPVYRLLSQLFDFSGLACEVLLPVCLDTLAAGALLAVLIYEPGAWPRRRRALALIGWVGFATYITLTILDYVKLSSVAGFVISTTAFALGAAGLIGHAAFGFSGWRRSILQFRPLVYVGAISYGLYLYHEIVSTLLDDLIAAGTLHSGAASLVALKFGLTFLAAAISWKFFERPINNLKRFFPYEQPHPSSAHTPEAIVRS